MNVTNIQYLKAQVTDLRQRGTGQGWRKSATCA